VWLLSWVNNILLTARNAGDALGSVHCNA
jgi:hypothetical protein